MTSERSVDRDLITVCEFEIALRNVLAWQGSIRRIVASYSDHGRPVGRPLLETTLNNVEQLMGTVAALRDLLSAQTDARYAD